MNKTLKFLAIISNIIHLKNPPLISEHSLQSYLLSYNYLQGTTGQQKIRNKIKKQIIIVDKGSGNLNQFIRKTFKLKELEQNDKEIGQQRLNTVLNQMKTSGYFRNINVKSKIVNKQQTITIECQSMAPLKSIRIKNNQNSIIPEKLIYRLFEQQINKPQNYKLINEALKCIYKWYYEKGYQWVNIKVVQSDSESIELEITEGIIHTIQFRFIKHIEESTTTGNIFLLQRIREFLGIKEGFRLNYNELETKLSELKQKQIFDNCDYTVLKSKHHPEELDLLLSIYEPPDRTTFLLGQNTNFRPGVVETIESKIFNSINILFREMIYKKSKRLTNNVEHKEYLVNIKTKSHIPIYWYNSQQIINQILTKHNIFSLSDLYEWYANPIHFINSNNLGIHYHIQNIGKQKEYIKVYFKFPSVYKNLVLTYCKPWIRVYRRQTSLLQVKLLKQSFYSNHKRITDLLSQIFNHKFIFLDSLSITQILKGKLKTQLDNNWSLKQSLRVEYIQQKKTNLQRRSETLFAKTVENLELLKLNQRIFMHSNSQLINNTFSHFLSVDTKLKYKFSYNHDIDWSKSGKNFMILSKYSMPYCLKSQYKLSNHYKKFSQRTILKYTWYKNHDFERALFNHQFFFFDLEIGNLMGSSTFFPWTEKFELRFPDYMIRQKNRIPNFPKLFYRLRFEYHLGTPNNHSVLLFCNYLYSNERHLFYKNKDVLNVVSKVADSQELNFRPNVGIGYQFRTSIHRLPPIRIEFSVSPKTTTTIYFRIIEVLSSIAIHKKT